MFRLLIVAVAAAAFAGSAFANGNPVPKSEADRVAAILKAKTGMSATAVETSPLKDFYTVIVGSSIYYMEKGGKWLFDGHLVDIDTKTSVTGLKKQELERAVTPALDWRELQFGDAIKTVRGTPTPGRVLIAFEDPNCGFCKKLHGELEKLKNVTVFTFPVAFLGPNSQQLNEAIWCSASPSEAWNAVMGNGAKPDAAGGAKCDTSALKRNGDLAMKLMVRGTPTMFLADGTRIPGYMDAASLEARLAGQATVAAQGKR